MSKYVRPLFEKDVTAAATAEPLKATSIGFLEMTVQAKKTNTGNIHIGNSSVSSALSHVLTPLASKSYTLPGDLNDIYIDADVSGEGVVVEYVEPV